MEGQHIHLVMYWKNMQQRTDQKSKIEKLNKMINFDEVTRENMQEHNLHWP